MKGEEGECVEEVEDCMSGGKMKRGELVLLAGLTGEWSVVTT
jgi:hypothetical protein